MSEELPTRFYTAFAAVDGEAMAACYHPDIVFSDPGFGELRGQDAGDMWRMLTGSARDLQIEHSIVSESPEGATVSWLARYTFGKAARPVTNQVVARMKFADQLIIEHHDTFDFRNWAGQALGVPGRLLGWAPPFQSKVRTQMRQTLRKYQQRGG